MNCFVTCFVLRTRRVDGVLRVGRSLAWALGAVLFAICTVLGQVRPLRGRHRASPPSRPALRIRTSHDTAPGCFINPQRPHCL